MRLDGFGKKSVERLLNSIENSRNVKLENFIAALGIPNIGLSAAKTIANYCNGNIYEWFNLYFRDFNWSNLDDFGITMAQSINDYFYYNISDVESLADEMNFVVEEKTTVVNSLLVGKNICVTGKLNNFTRDSINVAIESAGAKAVGSVSKTTDYLVTNEASGSSKYKKAVQLGIPIINEEEFMEMLK
jgi:DNA ligase (NAD+)